MLRIESLVVDAFPAFVFVQERLVVSKIGSLKSTRSVQRRL